MQSIPTNPQDPALTSPLKRALSGLTPPTTDPTQLFRDEVQRAVERQGGEDVLEERLGALTDARRADRAGGFAGYRSAVAEENAAKKDSRSSDDEDGSQILVEAPRSNEPDRVRATRYREPGEEHQANPDREVRERTSQSSTNNGQERASGDTSAPVAGSQLAGANASGKTVTAPDPSKLAAVSKSANVAAPAARPGDGVAPFLQGARGSSESVANQVGASAAPATPNSELIEQAAEVLKQIRVSLQRGAKEVAVQLTPAALGRLSIKLRMEDGKLTTQVRVENPETLQMLERQTPELRAVLVQQGFDAEQIDIELGFSAQGDDSRSRGESSSSREATTRVAGTGDAQAEGTSQEAITQAVADDGLIDTYA